MTMSNHMNQVHDYDQRCIISTVALLPLHIARCDAKLEGEYIVFLISTIYQFMIRHKHLSVLGVPMPN